MLEPDFYFVYKYYSTLVNVVLEKSSFLYQEINYEIAANSFMVSSSMYRHQSTYKPSLKAIVGEHCRTVADDLLLHWKVGCASVKQIFSFGRIAAPPEQIQGTYAEPRFSSVDKYLYSLHRRGRTHVFNYDSTVIKKDQLFSTLRFHLQYLRQLKKNAKNAFYMADKQEMYPLQFHKRFYFQMNRNSLGQNIKIISDASQSNVIQTTFTFCPKLFRFICN
ncbi:hypothetical protein T09_2816 [Trichinella sp. T9]|nr:hypothetical protein T09_2816 [Trichinella sp. T9]